MPNAPSNPLQAVEDAATELAAKTDGPPGVIVVVQRRNDRRFELVAGIGQRTAQPGFTVSPHIREAGCALLLQMFHPCRNDRRNRRPLTTV